MKVLGILVGIGAVSSSDIIRVKDFLNNVFANLEFIVLSQKFSPPISAYDWSRSQYISEKLLELLAKIKSKLGVDLVLGIAGLDAFSPGLNFVFGEALLGDGIAIVYTARLHHESRKVYLSRLYKEALHELGHALGLEHCERKECVMSFSNSIIEVDKKHYKYCKRCSARLAEIGIIVNKEYVLDR